ncbi:MAG: DUF47 domain-containing protein [Acidimicrobiales bacterium]
MRRWFLPESPDLLGMLARQGEITIRGIDAFADWSKGVATGGDDVRRIEREAELASREVLRAVKVAFVTPISPEDIYELSERLDAVLNAANNLVSEADLLAMDPDAPMAEMADLVALGVRDLVEAFPALVSHSDRATECADAAVRQQRALEHVYRRAMSALLQVDDIHVVTGRRELYRRYARIGDAIVGVAHRIWYAVVKEA